MIKKAVYIERAPAKINLFLDILPKREDGYHNIKTIFQAIDLADHLTFEINVTCGESESIDFEIEIDSNAPHIRGLGLNNLVTKAIETYFSEVPHEQIVSVISKVHIEVFIDKNIPIEAGLAGGSSNAAATLRALNKFFEENFNWSLSLNELKTMAAQLGSDVPFSLVSNQETRVYAEGRGELFGTMPETSEFDNHQRLIIVKPPFGVATADAYKAWDIVHEGLNSIAESKFGFYNAFEPVIFDTHPELLVIKQGLLALGCSQAILSGSGSAMLGFVPNELEFDPIFKKARNEFSEYKLFKASFLTAS